MVHCSPIGHIRRGPLLSKEKEANVKVNIANDNRIQQTSGTNGTNQVSIPLPIGGESTLFSVQQVAEPNDSRIQQTSGINGTNQVYITLPIGGESTLLSEQVAEPTDSGKGSNSFGAFPFVPPVMSIYTKI